MSKAIFLAGVFFGVALVSFPVHAQYAESKDSASMSADASYPGTDASYPGPDASHLGSDVSYPGSGINAPTTSDASYVIPIESAPIPPGMEIIRSGDVSVVVPKGSQLRKTNDLFVIESAEEYAARKFEVVEQRLDQLEKDQAEMKKELQDLKSNK